MHNAPTDPALYIVALRTHGGAHAVVHAASTHRSRRAAERVARRVGGTVVPYVAQIVFFVAVSS